MASINLFKFIDTIMGFGLQKAIHHTSQSATKKLQKLCMCMSNSKDSPG